MFGGVVRVNAAWTTLGLISEGEDDTCLAGEGGLPQHAHAREL